MKTVVHGPYLFPVDGKGGSSLVVIEMDDSEVLETMDHVFLSQKMHMDSVPGYTYYVQMAYGSSDWRRFEKGLLGQSSQ